MADEVEKSLHECIDCGFLGLRGSDAQFLEIGEEDRHLFYFRGKGVPRCYMRLRQVYEEAMVFRTHVATMRLIMERDGRTLDRMAAVFPEEVAFVKEAEQEIAGHQILNEQAAIYKKVLAKPIDCSSFRRYEQALSPREHREMVDREWMLEKEREWREEDRLIQVRLAEIGNETVKIARDTAWSTKLAAWAQTLTVLVGAIAIGVAVLFGNITIEDKRSTPTPEPTAIVVTPTPESR